MVRTRVIPVLLLQDKGLVKTIKFKDPKYVGDPINAVKIFNDKGVDELIFLDITATRDRRGPLFEYLKEIATECFMPFGYGGGIRTLEHAKRILSLGSEKVIINSYAVENPSFIKEAAKVIGNQSVVLSIDVKKNLFGKYEIWTHCGTKNTRINPVRFAQEMELAGAGEIMVNSIDNDGTMSGYDLELIQQVSSAVSIPVVACGGAGSANDLSSAVKDGGASAAAAGSLFVFHGKHRAVIITYPDHETLKNLFPQET
jgi:cyclase